VAGPVRNASDVSSCVESGIAGTVPIMKWVVVWVASFALFWTFELVVLGQDGATAAGAALTLAVGVTLGSYAGSKRDRRSKT
jgi:hypothetical protein